MFELFIALLGGAYYGGRYIKEKHEQNTSMKKARETAEAYEAKRQLWLNKVTDRDLEMKLEDFIYHKENYDAVWSEVSQAFSEMPWNKDRSFVCITPEDVVMRYGKGAYTKKQRENIAHNYRKEVLRIMMARRGKLIYNDAELGISFDVSMAQTQLQLKKWNEEDANFVIWINEQLKKRGINEELYTKISYWHAFKLEKDKSRGGTYVWAPIITPLTEILYE